MNTQKCPINVLALANVKLKFIHSLYINFLTIRFPKGFLYLFRKPDSEAVYASKTVHQLGTHLVDVLLAGAPAKVRVLGDQGEWVRALGHLRGRAPVVPTDYRQVQHQPA